MTIIAEHHHLELVMQCTVRDVRPADLPLLEWYGTHAHLRFMEQAAYNEVVNGTKVWLVAEANNFPCGHIKINLQVKDPRRGNPRGYLFALRVFEPFQGMGIGTALINAAEDVLRARGFRYVSIAVGKNNPRARRLYERLGYGVYREEVGRWQYVDLQGVLQQVEEPEYLLDKSLY